MTGLTSGAARVRVETARGMRGGRRVLLPDVFAPGGALLVYLVLTALVLRRGFLEYNADGYTRIIRGHEWLQAPRWEVGVWLPLQTWLFGAGLQLHDALTATPRVIDSLLTVWTLANLYGIGRLLGGRLAAVIAAGLGATFPWLVWLGVSGMSEPLFHATLTTGVLGFTLWLREPRARWLWLAGGGLALATMTRYEGWFYVAVWGPLALTLAWRRGTLRASMATSTLGALALPAMFPLLWMQQHQTRFGDAFGFARETAAIKAALEPANQQAGLLRRLTDYPEHMLRLAPMVVLLCCAAASYAIWRRVAWWPLLALVGGQAALLVGVSAGFSNLGPGAERYLLSNVILLFPVVGAAVALAPVGAPRLAAASVVALAAVLLAPTTLRPPTSYPDADTRAVAELARHALLAAPAGHGPIPLLLPAPPGDAYNVSYAVRILSEHPDDWLITTDPAVFRAVAGDRHPPLWLRDTRADQTDVPDTQRTQQVGRFQLGWPTPPLSVTVAVTQLSAGDTLDARVTGLTPGEAVSAWLTAPTDTVVPFDLQLRADAAGALSAQLPLPPDAAPGRWAVTFAGLGGNSSGALDFEIVSVLDNAP